MQFLEYEPLSDPLCDYCGRQTPEMMILGSMYVCIGCYRELEEEEMEQQREWYEAERKARERDWDW